jgi:hypothetical protein
MAMTMEAASTSETPVNFYQTTWRNIPGDNHLYTRRRENLKSYVLSKFFCVTNLLENVCPINTFRRHCYLKQAFKIVATKLCRLYL